MVMKQPDVRKIISSIRCFSDSPEEDLLKTMELTEEINMMMDSAEMPLHNRIISATGIMADSISAIRHTNPMCAVHAAKLALASLEPAFKVDPGTKSGVRFSPGVNARSIAIAECMKGKSLPERKRCMQMGGRPSIERWKGPRI